MALEESGESGLNELEEKKNMMTGTGLSEQNKKSHRQKVKICNRQFSTRSLKWIYRPCLLSVAMVTLCCVTFTITVAVLVQDARKENLRTDKPDIIFPHRVCMQCIKLLKNPLNRLEPDSLVGKLIKRVDDGIQMCCAESDDQLSALLEATIREQDMPQVPVFKTSQSRPDLTVVSAQKQLLPNSELNINATDLRLKNPSSHFIVGFNKDYHDRLTEHAKGITVLDTALEIQHSGTYYVYMSVHVAPKHNPFSHLHNSQRWSQYVHRESLYNPANNGILLEMSLTPCIDCSQHQATGFAGGNFYLEKGDQISVCLGGLGLVLYKKESSYLGLFLLSNGEDKSMKQF